jgi:hypothetical protein
MLEVSGNFPLSNLNGNWKLAFIKPSLNLVSLNITIQSRPIAFRRLTAFWSCYVPVSAFAFQLDHLFLALSYEAGPYPTSRRALSGRTTG